MRAKQYQHKATAGHALFTAIPEDSSDTGAAGLGRTIVGSSSASSPSLTTPLQEQVTF
jgi:hypothetical protein